MVAGDGLSAGPQSMGFSHLNDIAPADEQANNVGQGIPANGQWSDFYKDRINLGEGNAYHGCACTLADVACVERVLSWR